MTILAGQGEAGARSAQRLRAAVLGPRGGGTTRRRASDAFRLAAAVIVVVVTIPVMRDNSAMELRPRSFPEPAAGGGQLAGHRRFWVGSAAVPSAWPF